MIKAESALKDKQKRTHEEQEVEEEQEVLGGRDATFAHVAVSETERKEADCEEGIFSDIINDNSVEGFV